MEGQNESKGKIRKSTVRIAEVENDSPRNAEISLGGAAGISDENRVTYPDREVLISKET